MTEIPYGHCHCGCGEKTKINTRTHRRHGHVKGEPQKFVLGHIGRLNVAEQNGMWKGDAASDAKKRARAARLFKLGPCERCGKPAMDRHHIDGNTGNNTPENVAILCRRCHMEVDGRLERFRRSDGRKRQSAGSRSGVLR